MNPSDIMGRIARLSNDDSGGLWEFTVCVLVPGWDVQVPHLHGRVPDTVEIFDLTFVRTVAEALGVVFPTPNTGTPGITVDGIDLQGTQLFDPLDPPSQEQIDAMRPEGAPVTYQLYKSSANVVVRNMWIPHPLPAGAAYKTIGVLTMIRQGSTGKDPNAYEGLGITPDFSAQPLTGAAPLDVQFFSNMNGLQYNEFPANFEWDFGDGTPVVTGPFEWAPAHQYALAGTYDVTLIMTFPNLPPVTIVKAGYIVVT